MKAILNSTSFAIVLISLVPILVSTSSLALAEEQANVDHRPIPTILARRGKLILDDDGSGARGGKSTVKFGNNARLRAGAGLWKRAAPQSNVWRSTWKKGMGHSPVASYTGFRTNNLIVEVTFRYGVITKPWQTQSFRIAMDDRPRITGHIVSAWANPNNDFIEIGFLLQHIRKTADKKILEDVLLDHQPINVKPEVWYTATLEVVNDEALFRMGNHVAYVKAKQVSRAKNLVSLTFGKTWHEIRRVRIWEAEPNPEWQVKKAGTIKPRKTFTPIPHKYGNPGIQQ